MIKTRCYVKILGASLIGILLGSAGMFWYYKAGNMLPEISFKGRAVLDTATYQNPYLNNAIYLDNPALTEDRIYLFFQDDITMNAIIGKKVTVSGFLKTVNIGDGLDVTELTVVNVEYQEK